MMNWRLSSSDHPYPYVRFWVARILGDKEEVTPKGCGRIVKACTKGRESDGAGAAGCHGETTYGAQCLPIVASILDRKAGVNDPRVPWLVWWAIEDKATSNTTDLLTLFAQTARWQTSMWGDNSLRLLRRWAADGTAVGYAACDQLMRTVPAEPTFQALDAIRLGLAERSQGFEEITQGGLFASQAEQPSLEVPRTKSPISAINRTNLERHFLKYWREHPDDPLALELRCGPTIRTLMNTYAISSLFHRRRCRDD